jgi:hypothetical protein
MKTRQNKLRKPRRDKEVVPEASIGGILASTAIGAGTGAIGGGGVLSAPGAIIGGAVGLATGLWDHFKEKKQEKAEAKANLALGAASGGVQAGAGGSFNNFTDMWAARNGGVVPGGTKVSVEKKEVSMDPQDGTMKTFNEEAHPNDNVTSFKPGTVIFSDNPALTMPNGLTPAKNADKIKKLKDPAQKVLDNPNSSTLARKSAERNIANADRELGRILGFQVEMTQKMGAANKIAPGTVEEATWGEIVKATGTFLKSDTGKQTINAGLTLLPMAYNTIKGTQKVEQLNPAAFQNPMAYGALDSMRNRTPNMTPALQATDESMAAANANLRATSTGRGQYGANTVALANAAMKQKAGIYAQGSQMQNQYLGEYGQMQGAIGQKMADTNLVISDLNARNQAAGRSYGAAAAGQLSQWSQVQQQMNNQKSMDAIRMEGLKGYLDMFNTHLGVTPPTGTSTVSTQSTGYGYPVSDMSYSNQMAGRDLPYNK